jgi:hypothetical protein
MATLFADGVSGTVAIYTGSDDLPFTNPLDHLTNGRLKFHSDLNYPKVIDERTFTVSFPRRTVPITSGLFDGWFGSDLKEFFVSDSLFSHGQPGIPWVLGSAVLDGAGRAFCGSLPVQQGTWDQGPVSGAAPWCRWVTLGSTNSIVTLFEYLVIGSWIPEGEFTSFEGVSRLNIPAISVPIRVWVTDVLF